MDVSNLTGFYNSLFGIEIALFGIISAVILVFIQLIYSNYSYKHINHILTNKWFVFYVGLSTVDLLITAAGSYFLSLTNHDLIPKFYLRTDIIVSSPWYALVCLLLIFISIVFFILLVSKDLSYLHPRKAIFLLLKNTNYVQIRDFLWKKNRLEIPYNLRFKIVLDGENPKEINEENLKKQDQEDSQEIKRIDAVIEHIKKRVEFAQDPIQPIRDMMVQFIKKSDFSSLDESAVLVEQVTDTFFKSLPIKSEKWKPEDTLALKYTEHLIRLFETVLEVADKEQLESAKIILVELSYRIALKLLGNGKFGELDKIEELWQKIADDSIGKSTVLFQNIIGYYKNIGEKLFKLHGNNTFLKITDNEKIIENLFRYIGWIGERLLIKQPFEESVLFPNYSYSTEYDEYYNCLMTFSDIYNNDQPEAYPLVYFDVLIVIMKRLISIYIKDKKSQVDRNIFSFAYAFSSFAEKAIQVENARGAAISVKRIEEAYEDLKKAKLDKEANDVIKLLVEIGFIAAGNNNKLDFVDFIGKPLDQWIIEKLANSREDIASEVLESYIKTSGVDHDLRWGFIVELGKKMGTNFGFMFDASTGQMYAGDDPRRR